MREIKLMIKKFRVIGVNFARGAGDWGRYYTMEKMIMKTEVDFKTEAELMKYIYTKYGEGRFQILAWEMGHEGFWLYWMGNLYHNGFIRDKSRNKEMEKLKGELMKATDHDEREMISEEIDFEREISKDCKIAKRRGPDGLIKFPSGIMNDYDQLPPQRRVKTNIINYSNENVTDYGEKYETN